MTNRYLVKPTNLQELATQCAWAFKNKEDMECGIYYGKHRQVKLALFFKVMGCTSTKMKQDFKELNTDTIAKDHMFLAYYEDLRFPAGFPGADLLKPLASRCFEVICERDDLLYDLSALGEQLNAAQDKIPTIVDPDIRDMYSESFLTGAEQYFQMVGKCKACESFISV